jgi:hypothetical protein
MTRRTYIEQIRRLIYGGQPDDDAEITVGLVNVWLNQAIGLAAKTNYKDAIAIDGISYVNNSFYTIFKALPVVEDEQFIWKIELPSIPIGIGTSEGISTLKFKDFESRQLSWPVIWLSQNQLSYEQGMRDIPNKLLAYSQGKFIYVKSTLQLMDYTAQVTMISGGNSNDLDSDLNVPDDYIPTMTAYLLQHFNIERNQLKDVTPDGNDMIKTT